MYYEENIDERTEGSLLHHWSGNFPERTESPYLLWLDCYNCLTNYYINKSKVLTISIYMVLPSGPDLEGGKWSGCTGPQFWKGPQVMYMCI
jgi:hypothetical protein